MTFWRLLMPFIIGLVASLFTMPSVYDGDDIGGRYYEPDEIRKRIDTRRPPDVEDNLKKMGYVFLIIIPLAIQTYVGPCSFIMG